MKVFSIKKYSKKDKLELVEIETPVVKENEVLVEVHATSVNLLDSKIKEGEFKLILPYKLPLILGHDVAGVVVKVGSKVKNFKIGDAIYSRPSDFNIGTFAQFIAIDEKDVALKPNNISMEEAASIPLVGLTAWQAMVENGKLQKDRKYLFRQDLVVWELLLFN